MMSYRLCLVAVALCGFVCVASAADGSADRKKELKTLLFGAEHPLKKEEVLPLLKELKAINDKELAALPKNDVITPLGHDGEVRLLDEALKTFIEAGEVNKEKAKEIAHVSPLAKKIWSEIHSGVYYNIHNYLKAGYDAWWAAFSAQHNGA